jgi:quercetin dioxygenase-like cupin family protein
MEGDLTMTSHEFRLATEIPMVPVPFGSIRQIVIPATTGARNLVILEGIIQPGQGHDFHQHPRQEEVIYVKSGSIEQWVGKQKRILGPGDAVLIPPGTVHASFNAGSSDAALLAIFGPAIGDGFETVEMAEESPWRELRRS